MYYIGVDGGGTKTKFDLYDQSSNLIDSYLLGTCHYLMVTYSGCAKLLNAGVMHLLNSNNISTNNVRVCFGIAGYGQELSVRNNIEQALSSIITNYSYIIKSDVDIALNASLSENDGICIISGTGSIALGRSHNKSYRSGGFGHLLGDEGSAYWIAKKLLNVFTKQSDGRLPKSIIYDLVKEECSLKNDCDIISYVAVTLNNERSKIADLAKIAYRAAQQKDEEAIKIYEEAGVELANLCNALSKHYIDTEIEISYFGGVWKASAYILPSFKANIRFKCNIHEPLHEPTYGAYLYAKDI
ncbi:MAG: BadF/BadG/BcrA/BcrD ATPase family protein [Erysipelotrichaceae bacterium]